MPEKDLVCKKCGNSRKYTHNMVVSGKRVRLQGPCPDCRKGKFEQWVREQNK